MRKSLFLKYFSTSVVCVLLGFSLLLSMALMMTGRMWQSEKNDMLCKNVQSLAASANEMYGQDDFTVNLELISKSSAASNGTVVFFADRNGNVIACSEGHDVNNPNSLYNKKVPIDIMNDAYNGVYTELGNLEGIFDGNYYSAATAIVNRNGEIIGAVFTAYTAENYRIYIVEMLEIFAISVAVSIVVIFIVMYVMVHRMIRPLHEMSEGSERIANGDFSAKIVLKGNRRDEIAHLARSFNSMAATLEQLEYMHSSFVVNVSHELKTPMTTISGFVGGILDGTIPPNKHGYYLSIVSEEMERLSRLVNAMLELSHLQAGSTKLQPTRFDIDLVLQTTVLSMEPIITEKRLDVIGLDALQASPITADNSLIHQAMYNLIENAVKFADVGGYIKIGLDAADDGYNIIIENSGKGINNDELLHIFDRFYKTDKSRSVDKKGLGLGLYLVKSILQLHDGRISAESEPEHFTRFTVFLPKRQK